MATKGKRGKKKSIKRLKVYYNLVDTGDNEGIHMLTNIGKIDGSKVGTAMTYCGKRIDFNEGKNVEALDVQVRDWCVDCYSKHIRRK